MALVTSSGRSSNSLPTPESESDSLGLFLFGTSVEDAAKVANQRQLLQAEVLYGD